MGRGPKQGWAVDRLAAFGPSVVGAQSRDSDGDLLPGAASVFPLLRWPQ